MYIIFHFFFYCCYRCNVHFTFNEQKFSLISPVKTSTENNNIYKKCTGYLTNCIVSRDSGVFEKIPINNMSTQVIVTKDTTDSTYIVPTYLYTVYFFFLINKLFF